MNGTVAVPAILVFLVICAPAFVLWYLLLDWSWKKWQRFLERRLWRRLGGEGEPPHGALDE